MSHFYGKICIGQHDLKDLLGLDWQIQALPLDLPIQREPFKIG
jgi:hypothetical protein